MNTKKTFIIIFLILLMPVLPFLITRGWETKLSAPKAQYSEKKEEYTDINIKVLHNDEVINLSLYNYIYGVVAGEMPASYTEEALKAQAVAACSYTAYRMEAAKENEDILKEHNGAYVCTNSSHCKAYLTEDELKEKWGQDYELYAEKIENCVNEVLGEVITYNGKVANAVFHALSAGYTESALDIWGSDIPYLKSRESKEDTLCDNFQSYLETEKETFKSTLEEFTKESFENIVLEEVTATAHGTVKSLKISGKTFTGEQIRQLFSLRSANFQMEVTDSAVKLTVKGHGHLVGMSQFGANELGKKGKSYKEILKAYYTDIEIEPYNFK